MHEDSDFATSDMDRTIEIEMLPPTPLKEAPSALEAPKSPRGERNGKID